MKLNLQTFGDIRFGPYRKCLISAKVSSTDREKVGPDIVGSIPSSGKML